MSSGTLPVVRARGLTRLLGRKPNEVHVLRGVDLDLHAGEVVAIVGPSGCGKSTLLYLLGLIDRPDSGQLLFGDRDLSAADDAERTAERARRIGFVFQFHFLLPDFTVLENVLLAQRKLEGFGPEQARYAENLLREVGLADKLCRRASDLSGGEQQRVALARALANRPQLVLADEPTGNLDASNSALVFELLRSLGHERGQATVIVTHNPDLAQRCDRVLRMRDGLFES